MTVRLKTAIVLAFAAMLLGAGCGGERSVFSAETDDPYYQEGKRLVRQGREAEALSAFLKVIEKRGEQASAESHFEAGLICLYRIKDSIEAIHHFRKYLELQPNSKQAPGVRSLIETAKREFARSLPAHPLESQAVGIEQSEQLRQLQRENDDLRTQLGAQHTANATQFLRTSRAPVEAPEASTAFPDIPLITPAPLPKGDAGSTAVIVADHPSTPRVVPPVSPPKGNRGSTPVPSAARKHVIAPGDTLYRISVKYFGNGSKVDEIFTANHDVMSNKNTLPRVGTELKIP